jgi:hypothetical protein
MEMEAIRTRQSLAAQAQVGVEQTLRSKLADIALLHDANPAQAVAELKACIGAGLVDPSLPLTQQLVEQLNLRGPYMEATARALSHMSDTAAWRILDGTHDQDPKLYRFIVRHSVSRGRWGFRRFSGHSKDFKRRQRAIEKESKAFREKYDREMAPFRKEAERFSRRKEENPLLGSILFIGAGCAIWYWLANHQWGPELRPAEEIEAVTSGSPTPTTVESWRLRRGVSVPVPQGQVTIPAEVVVTLISRTNNSARVRWRGYEFEVNSSELVPVP